MNGKFNYNNDKIKKSISKAIHEYDGTSEVIYFFDTDDFTVHSDDKAFCLDAARYCQSKGYDVVWFVETIEVVFYGHRVSDKEKIKKSDDFIRKGLVNQLKLSRLNRNPAHATKTSNIMTIFDTKLTRKSE
jgi:hypothetical protein